jgi:hypothetical protein
MSNHRAFFVLGRALCALRIGRFESRRRIDSRLLLALACGAISMRCCARDWHLISAKRRAIAVATFGANRANRRARMDFLQGSNTRNAVLSLNPHENSVCQLRVDKVFVYFT